MTLHRPAGTLATDRDPLVLGPDDVGWTYCGLTILDLEPGVARRMSLDGVEAAVVPLRGGCQVTTADGFFADLRGRSSPLRALTDVCYLPPGAQLIFESPAGARVAVATARATTGGRPFYRNADEVDVSIRGAGHASRQVNGLLDADVDGPERLLVVEVLTPGGNWSSYPPHKHDEFTDAEVPLEEIYYFHLEQDDAFALHRTYTTDGELDETVTVRDGDVFLVPRGYHGPSVAAPGYDLYYLNVMAGPAPERSWLICTDPAHAWLWDSWTDQPADPRLPLASS